MNTAPIVSKVWSFCNTLRDDGVGYGDYLEQLTYLIFLKMADEYAKPPYNRDVGIPDDYAWPILKAKRGAELEAHYISLLRELGKRKDVLGQIFTKAQNKIQDPAKLYRLINMIDEVQWVSLEADVKGDIYEGLLEKNAEDTKSGAGQYFTPRALIKAMVECIRPEPGKTIADPSCGTGGFFLAAYDFLTNPENYKLDKAQKAFLKHKTFNGNEIVAGTRRLCLMNMFLHNIGEIDGDVLISPNDALVAASDQTFDYVLANPPFGKKSSMSFTNDDGEEESNDDSDDKNKKIEKTNNHIYFHSEVNRNSIFELTQHIRQCELDNIMNAHKLCIDPIPIYLHINSFGGVIFDALTAIDVIKACKVPVYTIIEGATASAGTLISVVGQKRFIRPNAHMLIHQLSSG